MAQILFFLLFSSILFAGTTSRTLSELSVQKTIAQGIPQWMNTQIEQDFAYFKNKPISLKELNRCYRNRAKTLQVVKFTIKNNRLIVDNEFIHASMHVSRIGRYVKAITTLCKTVGLPDMTFLLSVNDGLDAREEVPIFAMCKRSSNQIILIPDYEVLDEQYQVLSNRDITKLDFPWETKKAKLIWRGSTAQLWRRITEKDIPLLSRVTLCEISLEHPELIDAKFTIFAQGGENIPYLRTFEGMKISFEDQFEYKYAIVIDGNTYAYSASGWKLFGNFLIFKPESDWVQWYSAAMKPWEHYIPVRSDLTDLVEKIEWAKKSDGYAERIARNCRDFALSHIVVDDDLAYLYFALVSYSRLSFTN